MNSGTSGAPHTPSALTAGSGSSSELRSPRYAAQIDVKSWVVEFADLKIERLVGEGSFGKASELES